jgi:hypothetical protein
MGVPLASSAVGRLSLRVTVGEPTKHSHTSPTSSENSNCGDSLVSVDQTVVAKNHLK